MTSQARLFLIDAHALCYRSFYAIKELATRKGQATNAVYGFVNTLRKILREHQPEYMAVCFDSPVKTHRQEKYAQYKIQRPTMPDSLICQIPLIKQVVKTYGLTLVESGGYEADDLIATLATRFAKKNLEVVIVTEDKDMFQLVNDKVKILSFRQDAIMGPEEIKQTLGFEPNRITDFIALAGDQVDNIPGVKGIGEVTARKLIEEYGNLDNVLKNVEQIKSPKVKEAISAQRDAALLSKELAVLDRQVPVNLDLAEFKVPVPDQQQLYQLFQDLEFKKFAEEASQGLAPKKSINVTIVEDEAKFKALTADIRKSGRLTFLFSYAANENFDLVDNNNYLAICVEGKVYFWPIGQIGRIKDIMQDTNILKVTYDLKEAYKHLENYDLPLAGPFFDIMLADYLLAPSQPSYELKDMIWGHLKQSLSQGNQLAQEVQAIAKMFEAMEPALKEKKLVKLFEEIEIPLAYVLFRMEKEGVKLDTKLLKKLSDDCEKKITILTKKLYQLAGGEFNMNSPKQLAVVLFEKLKLPVVKKTKTGLSTDESVLTKLAPTHEFPALILEYRQLAKLKSTYIDALPELINPQTGRVHADFVQVGTETGRLSSRNPNLQNIPIRAELGRQIRKAIVPLESGHVLISADYSQIELRILAHLSGDKNLKEAFLRDQDIHRYTASLIFEIDEKDVTNHMRDTAKRVNFGIIYGMSAFGLSKDLQISQTEAQEFIDRYFLRYPQVKNFIDETTKQCEKDGYVLTLLNRRRYIPEINSANMSLRQFAQRQAINTPVQGSAADLLKLAMINIQAAMEKENLESKMLITVHDELVFDVVKKEEKEMVNLIRQHMEHPVELSVPIKVSVQAGPNWLDTEEL